MHWIVVQMIGMNMYDLIKGLLQTAVEMRAYRRLRIKVFLRSRSNR